MVVNWKPIFFNKVYDSECVNPFCLNSYLLENPHLFLFLG
jgi:hypothetical protein